MFRLLTCSLFAAILSGSHAQSVLRVMDYNLLNFPLGQPAGRADTLRKILAYRPVDLLVCQEVRTADGAASILSQALNAGGVNRFSAAPYVAPISAPWITERLAQTLYYDHTKLGLKRQSQLTTQVRDINVYDLYLRTPQLASGDTVFLTVYAVHLKAGTNDSDLQSRLTMVNVLRGHMASLPAGRSVIVTGDMNIYSGQEIAFTTLLQPAGNITLQDPLDLGDVNWAYNVAFASFYTQSTRTSTLMGEGSGGGIDDRFDIALLSSDLLDPGSVLRLVPGSYKAFGNSGTCYNQSITSCSTAQTPMNILRSLYYMSDHVPVVFDLRTDLLVGTPEVASVASAMRAIPLGDGVFRVERANPTDAARILLFDLLGRLQFQRTLSAGAATLDITLPQAGAYVLRTDDGSTVQSIKLTWAGE